MAETNIDQAVSSNLTNTMTDYSVDTMSTDAQGSQKETEWTNAKWTQYFGYYKTIPELMSTIDARATWTIGKGFKSDEATEMLLMTIKGWGKDTFNTILENMIRTMWIGGDSFAEIIRDDENILINLKPLDPLSITIVVDKKGLITKYKQTTKVGNEKVIIRFEPEDIFHLARNRVADEIHGVSVIEKLEWIILARNEAMTGYKDVMKKYMKPRYIFHLDTDDETKIAVFKNKMDKAWTDGENMYIPKGAVVPEMVAISPNATLNPLAWIDSLNDYFYEACSTPKIIVGNSKNFTEASAKIVYLAFQQSVEEDQLFIEEEVLSQLNLFINLEFPASLENELLSDEKSDGGMETRPSEVTAGSGQ